jgi:hypothetical protein
MQSGAFLHLVVTLTALVARMAHLCSAVRGVLSTLHAECAHLLARLHVRSKLPSFARAYPYARSDAKITSLYFFVQPTEASRNLAPPLPPPPLLEGEDPKVSGAPLERNRRTVQDSDLDVFVDLGEAITRTPALTPRPKFRSVSPVLPDGLSPAHDATLALVVGARQPGECNKNSAASYVSHAHFYAHVQPPPPPTMPHRLQLWGLRHHASPQ